MWSLPDINRMNSEASSQKRKLERAAKTGILDREKLTCEWQGHDELSRCSGELRHYLWYDIFSDDPKGILTLCEHHDGYYGSPSEGYFDCAGCNRVMIENYTWEYYRHITEDGETLCLPCFAHEVLADDDRWTQLADEKIDGLTFEHVRKAPHCIGVRMPIPKAIRFVNNVEFDSSTGQCISGGGIDELKETLRQLKNEGSSRAILILDAAYQFAVSIAVYAPVEGGRFAKKYHREFAALNDVGDHDVILNQKQEA